MRVVLLSQFYPPVIGGEERHVISLSRSLAKRGHEVSVLSLPHPERPDTMIDQDVTIKSVRGIMQRFSRLFSEQERPHAAPIPDPELAYRIGEIVAEIKPDIVHGHNWMSRAYLPSRHRFKSGFIVTLHDYSLSCARKNFMHQAEPCSGPGLMKCFRCARDHYGAVVGTATCAGNWVGGHLERRTVDHYIAVSRAVAKGCHIDQSKTPYDVLPTFIPDDLADLAPVVDGRIEALPKGDYLLFVGDLTHGKGIHVLLRAYRQLKDPPPLVMIGRVCADTPRDLPPNVLIFPSWPHAAVMMAWKNCLFGMAPSVWPEACGTIVMEGNVVGKAMIASASGGLSDLIDHGETGLLVPPDDANALAVAMQFLIQNPEVRERMGATGARHVERFMAKSIVPRIEDVYRRVIRSRHMPKERDNEDLMQAANGLQ